MALLSRDITVVLTPEENEAMSEFVFAAVTKYPELFKKMDENSKQAFHSAVRKFSAEEAVIQFHDEMDKNL